MNEHLSRFSLLGSYTRTRLIVNTTEGNTKRGSTRSKDVDIFLLRAFFFSLKCRRKVVIIFTVEYFTLIYAFTHACLLSPYALNVIHEENEREIISQTRETRKYLPSSSRAPYPAHPLRTSNMYFTTDYKKDFYAVLNS